MNMWLEEGCPECESINWVNCGNITDQTFPDPSSTIRCWNCSKLFQFEDVYEDLDEDSYEEGLEYPQNV